MQNLVQAIYADAALGVVRELEAAGTGLENPYVYDSAARDLKTMADRGLVKIVHEQMRPGSTGPLIRAISFARLR